MADLVSLVEAAVSLESVGRGTGDFADRARETASVLMDRIQAMVRAPPAPPAPQPRAIPVPPAPQPRVIPVPPPKARVGKKVIESDSESESESESEGPAGDAHSLADTISSGEAVSEESEEEKNSFIASEDEVDEAEDEAEADAESEPGSGLRRSKRLRTVPPKPAGTPYKPIPDSTIHYKSTAGRVFCSVCNDYKHPESFTTSQRRLPYTERQCIAHSPMCIGSEIVRTKEELKALQNKVHPARDHERFPKRRVPFNKNLRKVAKR